MANQKVLQATKREESGKNAMRRIRKQEMLPGIVFGRSGDTIPVTFKKRELEEILHTESGFNAIFKIKIDGEKEYKEPMVMIKDYQVDPVTHDFLHFSFYRVHMDRKIQVSVPIIITGVPFGVKNQACNMEQGLREIEVECFPGDIPEHFTIDVTSLRMNDYFRVGDLKLSDTVEILHDEEALIVHVVPPRKGGAEEEAAEAGEEEAAEEAEE